MSETTNFLAIDLGASSGRVMAGRWNGQRFALHELHRFPNGPVAVHGHLHCTGCGTTWEIPTDEAEAVVASLRASRRFAVDVTHLSISGKCAGCSEKAR